jgi:hypothetical protein
MEPTEHYGRNDHEVNREEDDHWDEYRISIFLIIHFLLVWVFIWIIVSSHLVASIWLKHNHKIHERVCEQEYQVQTDQEELVEFYPV